MTFFNKKEDVIKIELTPYGRSLLSKGTLMPAYYAFFDDDILYDVMAAGATGSEDQNLIQRRILEETPRLRPQRSLESPEKMIFRYERTQENSHPHTELKMNYLSAPLGTSKSTSDFGPSWNSLLLKGEISGAVRTFLTGGTSVTNRHTIRQIPQIDVTVEYTMQVKNVSTNPNYDSTEIEASRIFSDGTYIEVTPDQLLCQLKENDGFLFKDGLEMEVYVSDDTSDGWLPLKFRPNQTKIQNGILMDETRGSIINIDPSYVEYYLQINLDSEIPDDDLCEGIRELKTQDLGLELDIECPDLDGVNYDIYTTKVDSVEKCD